MASYSCNHRSKMNFYQQDPGECAGTCAGMCVKKSATQMRADGIDVGYINWSKVASKYGYNHKICTTTSALNSPSTLLSYLKLGYPIIAQTRSTSINGTQYDHYVTVYAFSGNDASPSWSNFTCGDPAPNVGGDGKQLDLSDNFKGFYRYVYYY